MLPFCWSPAGHQGWARLSSDVPSGKEPEKQGYQMCIRAPFLEIPVNWGRVEGECEDSACWPRCVFNYKPPLGAQLWWQANCPLFHRETGSAFQSAVSMLCLVGGIAGYEFPSLQPYRAPECKSYWPPEPGCWGVSSGQQLQKPGHQTCAQAPLGAIPAI